MSQRDLVVSLAAADVGLSDPKPYWRVVLGSAWVGPYPKHWCGAFALYKLREAGLCDWLWQIKGILGATNWGFLFRLERTNGPQPGDCCYLDQPFQHYCLVERVEGDTVHTIDGNQGTPGIQRKSHKLSDKRWAHYTIASLLAANHDTEPQLPAVDPTLRIGATGEVVKALQTLLNVAGASLVVDGGFGPKTAAAVMSFQRKAGLDPDGVVGPRTWGALHGTS